MELFKILGRFVIDGKEKAKDDIDEVTVKAKEANEQMAKSTSSAGESIAKAGSFLSGVGAVITAGVTVPVTGFFAAASSKALDFVKVYENTMVTFRKRLEGGEEAAQKLYNGILDIAKASTMSQEVFLQAGQYLVGIGISADKTEQYLTAAKDAVSAFGGSGADVQHLSAVFGDIANSGRITGQDIMQMSNNGVDALGILAAHFGITRDEASAMVSNGLIPGAEAIDIITGALEETNPEAATFQYSVAGMGEELKRGTLTGALDSLGSSVRSFGLQLLGVDPRIAENQERLQGIIDVINKVNDVLPKMGALFAWIPPLISKATETVSDLLDKFNAWLDAAPDWQVEALGKAIVGLAAAGPILLMLGKAFGTLGGVVGGLGGMFSKLPISMAGMLGPLGLIAAAIAVLVAVSPELRAALGDAFMQIATALQPLIPMFTGLVQQLLPVLIPLLTQIASVVAQVLTAIMPLVSTLIGSLMPVIQQIIDIVMQLAAQILPIVTELIAALIPVIMPIVDFIVSTLLPIIEIILSVVTEVLNALMPVIQPVLDIIIAAVSIFTSLLKGDWEGVWNGILSFLQGIWDLINTVIKAALDILSAVFTGALDAISSLWNSIWTGISNFFSGIWDGLYNAAKAGVDNVYNKIIGIKDSILGFFSGAGDWLYNAGKWILEGLLNGLKAAVDGVTNFVSGIGAKIASLKGPKEYDLKLLVPAGGWIMEGLETGLGKGLKGVLNLVSGAGREISDALDISASYSVASQFITPKSLSEQSSSKKMVTNNYYFDGKLIQEGTKEAGAMKILIDAQRIESMGVAYG